MDFIKNIFKKPTPKISSKFVDQIGEMKIVDGLWMGAVKGVDITFDCPHDEIPEKDVNFFCAILPEVDGFINKSVQYEQENDGSFKITKEMFSGVTIVTDEANEDFRIDFELNDESGTFYSAIFKDKEVIDYDCGD
jgi:hypothetical protein